MSEIVASIYEKIERTGLKEGILFIDEINCVSETLAPAMLQFLQCKTFGNHKIPDGWLIVAAETHRSITNPCVSSMWLRWTGSVRSKWKRIFRSGKSMHMPTDCIRRLFPI